MPHEVVQAKDHDRNRSLGWLAIAWMEWFCIHGPGDVQGEPVRHGDEMSGFIADCYAVNGEGRLLYDSTFLSRPKGADKSGLGARFAMFESLGPCRFAGFAKGGEVYRDPWGLGFEYRYQPGDPMGRHVTSPYVRIMATEEGQTGNVYDAIHVNLTEGLLSQIPGLNVGLTRTILPGGGEITPSTASGASKDGGKETFVVFDETHLYNTPELRRMYKTVTRNLRKRKKIAGTWYLETTTMFAPGEESIAESTYTLSGLIREGKTRRERLFFDHRYGECEDLSAEDMLRAAILEAFGEAIDWNDIDGIVDEFYDPRASTSDSRRYFLNAPTSAEDAWLAHHEVVGAVDASKVVADRDVIVVGFDGSRKRSHAVTDATALIGCRVHDGHLFEIRVWEQPSGPAGENWEIPSIEVEAEIKATFKKYTVVGLYADPAKWSSQIAAWEGTYGSRMKVKCTRDHPMHFPSHQPTPVVRAVDQLHTAIVGQQCTLDGSSAFVRHLVNARRRPTRAGIQIQKEHPESSRKIDAAYAAVLAWQARLAAIAAGVTGAPRGVPRRIR